MKRLLPPAHFIVMQFGSVTATAKAIGVTKYCVSRWQHPRGKKKDEWALPGVQLKKILIAARERGIDITPEDLIFGRVVDE